MSTVCIQCKLYSVHYSSLTGLITDAHSAADGVSGSVMKPQFTIIASSTSTLNSVHAGAQRTQRSYGKWQATDPSSLSLSLVNVASQFNEHSRYTV